MPRRRKKRLPVVVGTDAETRPALVVRVPAHGCQFTGGVKLVADTSTQPVASFYQDKTIWEALGVMFRVGRPNRKLSNSP